MLPDNIIEENLSIAYVKAVSSMAGYEINLPSRDWGTDVQLSEVDNNNGTIVDTGIYLRVQLKACKNTRDLGDKIAYDLKNKARNKLIQQRTSTATPIILVVLCLDPSKINWVTQDLDKLILKKCAYWCYLEGDTTVPDNENTTVLHIPKTNIFSAENVKKIMDCVKSGGDLHVL